MRRPSFFSPRARAWRPLDAPSHAWLLARAREAMARHLAHHPRLREPEFVPLLCEQKLACFVTVHNAAGQLRGCVGALDAYEPLWRQAEQMAIAAATRDPRFPAMRTHELDDATLEIAVLSPHQPVQPEAVEVGRHGLWIEHGVHRGVLLPQAALSYGWSREAYLSEGCQRAGLSAEAWRRGEVQVQVFEADVFTEATRLQ
jgi:AmmeMemoRadiSam system protein A